jgi:2-amino-4-hydroxy-6-hydroxymethyldihydropteridine diphosphokinase
MAQHSYLVAVGSNLGDRESAVNQAIALLRERGMSIHSISELVETNPIGNADQVFLNGALICSGDIDPADFMRLLLDIEDRMGRVRDVRWGNRVIDLDVLLVRDESGHSIEFSSPLLTVPHPRMLERDFMLRPAAAVAGHWTLPQSEQTIMGLCVSRGWRPTWSNLKGDIKLWQALKGDVYAATTSRLWWPVLIFALFVRLWFAATVPYGNDEAYYWDWGRQPLLSFYDHPPFVAWIALLSRLLVFSWLDGPIQGRLLVPFLHLLSTLLFGALVVRLTRRVLTNLESRAILLITQLVPAFSLGGVMLMPDVGLILFSTLAVWIVAALSRRASLKAWSGVLVGVTLGLAGLSKYHAALIGGGLLAWLFWNRQESFDEERPFWGCVLFFGLLTIAPVIIWNYENQWVSIRFQGARGVAGGGFDVARSLRTLVGEAVFLGPLVLGGIYRLWKLRSLAWRGSGAVIVWAALPMLVVLKLFSFTTQTLPHWSMPSFWLLSALVVPAVASSRTLRWSGRLFGFTVCVVLPLLLSSAQSRRAVLRWTGDRPGGLGELTLWDTASRDKTLLEFINDHAWTSERQVPHHCDGVAILAPRWFTVAQIAATFPAHPHVRNLDPDHLSYYHFRRDPDASGCPAIIIAEKSHWREEGFPTVENIVTTREWEIDGHRDRPVIVARAWIGN